MRNLTLLFVILAVASSLLFGQGVTGSIVGVVTDPNGAVVPNVKVVAHNVDTSADTVGYTRAEGSFTINNLPPGVYTLEITAEGFRHVTTSAQRVTVAGILREDVTLEIGKVSESVTVEANASQVNTVDSQLGKAIIDIPQLPVLSGAGGRNALQLATTMPGVVNTGNNAVVSQAGAPFSVNGGRAQSVNFLLDGGDDNDSAINTPTATVVISPNALSEFRLITGSFNAEYGRDSSAIIEVNTKSGTNGWHGIASETFRNTRLNASPFFQNSVPGGTTDKFSNGLKRRPQWNTNDWDANFGGPLRRDKTFFFVSYLGFRRRQGVANSATVPNDAQRALINQNGTPVAKALLALIPVASTGNLLFSSPANSLNRDQGLARVDHYFTQSHQLSATYFIEVQDQADPFAFGGSNIPGFGTTNKANIHNAVLRDAYTFSPTLFNEARISFHRFAQIGVEPANKSPLSSLGLGAIIPDDAAAQGPPFVNLTGFSSFGNTIQGPQGRYDDTLQAMDSLSWTKGRHELKFGGEGRVYTQNQIFDFINNGDYFITGAGVQSGIGSRIPGLTDALSDFANGFAAQFVQNSAGRRGYRTHAAGLYAQDIWKVNRRFTLNLGLRWEYNSPLQELANRTVAFRPGQQSTVFPTAPVGLVYPGDKGIAPSTYSPDWHDFGPRVGFAWDVLGNGKLSVRSGFGMFYDSPISELTLQFLTSAPYAIQPFTLFTAINNPWLGSQVNPLPQPFPFTPVQPGARFNFVNIAPISITVMDPKFRTPRSYNYNFQVQYQLAHDWVVDAAYVGAKGANLLNRRQINFALPGPGATTGNTDLRRIYNQGNPQDAAFGGAVFSGITDQLSDADSSYSSLQINVSRRFAHGFSMAHAYTWGHGIDDSSALRSSSNVYNYRNDRGNSDFDVRHRYVGTYIYEIPVMKDQKGIVGHILGGWGVSGITAFQTGLPFSVTEPTDRCLCAGGNERPDFLGGTVVTYDPRSVSPAPGVAANSWFNGIGGGSNTAAGNPYFARVGSGTTFALGAGRYGNLGRNTFHGPGINNWDLSAFKRFRIREQQTFEFRTEFFNAFNHTQFLNPSNSIGSATFGVVSTTQSPRVIQMSARYQF